MGLKFAVIGAGYWAQYQIAAWRELPEVQCVAICDPDRSRAASLAERFSIPSIYEAAAELLAREELDFVDIVSSNGTHAQLVHMCAVHGIPVICQKPMAPTLADCEQMVDTCRIARVPFLIHENWRWQSPIRALKMILDSGVIGEPVRANLRVATGVDDFQNQPFLKELERMVLADMGVHLLDVSRFLFGEAISVFCQTTRVQPDIKGEDMATVMLRMNGVPTVLVQLAFARIPLEHDYYVQTLAFIEGRLGSIELAPDYSIRVTTAAGTDIRQYSPRRYPWGEPGLDACMASIVDCQRDILQGLTAGKLAETTAGDNLKTMRLLEACYESARGRHLVAL